MASMTREHRITKLQRRKADLLNSIKDMPMTVRNREHKVGILRGQVSSIDAALARVRAQPEIRQPVAQERKPDEAMTPEPLPKGYYPGWLKRVRAWVYQAWRGLASKTRRE